LAAIGCGELPRVHVDEPAGVTVGPTYLCRSAGAYPSLQMKRAITRATTQALQRVFAAESSADLAPLFDAWAY
jgi:hypothetical protein